MLLHAWCSDYTWPEFKFTAQKGTQSSQYNTNSRQEYQPGQAGTSNHCEFILCAFRNENDSVMLSSWTVFEYLAASPA